MNKKRIIKNIMPIIMSVHKCKNCNYRTNLKTNMLRHLNKKNKCYETEKLYDGLQIKNENVKSGEPLETVLDDKSETELDDKNESELDDKSETELENETETEYIKLLLTEKHELEILLKKQILENDELTKTNEALQKTNDEYYEFIESRDDVIEQLKNKIQKYKNLSRDLTNKKQDEPIRNARNERNEQKVKFF